MFLHYNPYPNYSNSNLYTNDPPKAEVWSKERSMKENMGSGAGYVLSRNGASNLLKHVQKYGVYNAIDWVMFKSENKIMYVTPLLVKANCYQTTNGTDTDIQNVYNSVCFNDNWDTYELEYLSKKLLESYENLSDNQVFLYSKDTNDKDLLLIASNSKISKNKNITKFSIQLLDTYNAEKHKNHICILPIKEKSNVLKEIELQLVKTYITNKFIYCIPDKYAYIMSDDKVWDNTFLNIECPF